MEVDKIGKFILELRKEKELTQEELAELIPIGRAAVSKWERGVTIPDPSTLLRLSDIFGITVNEILYGEKINKNNLESVNNITIKLYDSNNKSKRVIKILFICIFLLMFVFLGYYFISSYKSIKVYTILGEKDDTMLFDGIFINTKNKLYFRIDSVSDMYIDKLVLYYIDKEENEQIIYETLGNNISFIDYYGYDEYFDSKNMEYLVKNLYLKVENKNDTFSMKLILNRDYVNDNLFFKKKNSIGNSLNSTNVNSSNVMINSELLISKIKDRFDYKDNIYLFETKNTNVVKKFIFFEDSNTLYLNINNDSKQEEWYYNLQYGDITYSIVDKKMNPFKFVYSNSEFSCIEGECSLEQEKISIFIKEITSIL